MCSKLHFTKQLLKKQLILFRQVANARAGDALRQDTFVEESLQPKVEDFVRCVGRPRLHWTQELANAGSTRFGVSQVSATFDMIPPVCNEAESWTVSFLR